MKKDLTEGTPSGALATLRHHGAEASAHAVERLLARETKQRISLNVIKAIVVRLQEDKHHSHMTMTEFARIIEYINKAEEG